ncbi:MAG TPA: amidohydrolase family protein [Thermoanaerobaculia bacterium]
MVALATPTRPAPVSRGVAITHVRVIDVRAGAALPDRTVLVREGRIAAVGGPDLATAGARVVDGRGKFLIPGLWDMHVHLSWSKENALLALLANGVTGVRDMGGDLPEIDNWRARITAGVLAGPRIFRVGPILNGKKFNQYQMVTGNADETRGVVRALKQVGVDFIKTHRRTERDSYFAMIDEAKKQGLDVVGHIPVTVTPEEAIDSGQRTIEHTETLFEGTFSAGLKEGEFLAAIRKFRAGAADVLFARFVKNGTFFDPTLTAYRSGIESMDGSALRDPRRRYVAQSYRKAAEKDEKKVSAEELAGWKATFAELIEVVRQLHRAGVPLLTGTDLAATRVPGFTVHDELALLVSAGLTPLEALRASTLHPAEAMRKTDDLGAIEAGKAADLVLLDADPLADIRNTERITAVIAAGKLFARADLDRLLREAEALASRN